MKKVLLVLIVAMMNYGPTSALAVPQQINYQGSLTGSSGTPLDTTVSITFNIWPVPAGGSPNWTETHATVTVQEGLFAVQLGSVTTLPDLFAANRWLGITVGGDAEMSPRQQIISVAHAYRVGTVDGATGGTITSDVIINSKLNVGVNNTNTGVEANVFGRDNTASNTRATVSGGRFNTASGFSSVVSGGISNSASGDYSGVGSGRHNQVRNLYAFIGGGGGGTPADSNSAQGFASVIAGGQRNLVTGGFSTVSGGAANEATQNQATVGGGYGNTAGAINATVAGGVSNSALGYSSTVSGGVQNFARGIYSVIAGGGNDFIDDSNSVTAEWGAIVGGRRHLVSGASGFIGGGYGNQVTSSDGVIGGGQYNTASGNNAVIGGGYNNTASGWASTIPGGILNTASGDYSFAAGDRAKATNYQSFVWSSSSTLDSTTSFGDHTVTFRCQGGARFYTAPGGLAPGVNLPAGGGAWGNLCDVNEKNLYGGVNTSDILQKVSELPLHRWSYKTQDESIRHIGPTAQDFYAAFGLGDNNTTISTLDPDGVLFAAVQELAKQNASLLKRIEQLEMERSQFTSQEKE